MEHTVFTIFIILIALLLRIAKSASGTPIQGANPRANQTNTESEEVRMRRFMEAVGLPPDAAPPPRQVPPRPAATAQAPLPTIKPPPIVALPTTSGRLRRVPFPPGSPLVPRPAGSVQAPPPLRRVDPASPLIPLPDPAPPSAPEPTPSIALPRTYEEAAPGVPAIGRAAVAEAKPQAIPATSLLARLRDPAAVREAVILREILGPPKALRPPGLIVDLPALAL